MARPNGRRAKTPLDREADPGQLAPPASSPRTVLPGAQCRRRSRHDDHGRGLYFSAVRNLLSRFVDSNDRVLKRLQPLVDEINELEAEFQALTDEEIRERIGLRDEIREDAAPDEPSEDELDQPELERRRELAGRAESATTSASRTSSTTRCPRSSRRRARRCSGSWACATSTSS